MYYSCKKQHTITAAKGADLQAECNGKRATIYDGTHRRYSENTEISGPSAAIIVGYFLQRTF
jgi:hypothetical protein